MMRVLPAGLFPGQKVEPGKPPVIYECGICGAYHPWNFDGDCRDDQNRIADPDEYAKQLGVPDVEVRSMDDRVAADLEGG
jgi:hypothetical protein